MRLHAVPALNWNERRLSSASKRHRYIQYFFECKFKSCSFVRSRTLYGHFLHLLLFSLCLSLFQSIHLSILFISFALAMALTRAPARALVLYFQIVHNDAEWFHWTVGLMQLHRSYCWIQIMLKTKCRQIKCSHRPLLSLFSYVNTVEFKFNRFVAETSVYLFIFFLYIFFVLVIFLYDVFVHSHGLSLCTATDRFIQFLFACIQSWNCSFKKTVETVYK